METEERSSSPMSNTSWATLGEFDTFSNDGSSHDGTDVASLIEGSLGDDILSLDGNEEGSEGSITDIDAISTTSETQFLVTPSLPHTDDEYNDVEHEYEDEDEPDHGNNAATPSGWGSTPDLAEDEYEQDRRVAEENRVYMQSDRWVSTSSLDEPEYGDDDGSEVGHVSGVQDAEGDSKANSVSDVQNAPYQRDTVELQDGWSSTRTPESNRLTEADSAVLRNLVNRTSREFQAHAARTDGGNNQNPNEQGQKKDTFLMKIMSIVNGNMEDVITPCLLIVLFILLTISMTVLLGVACIYIKAGMVIAFQACAQPFGFFSSAQESAATSRVQTIPTHAAPVLSMNVPVFSTSPDGVSYVTPNPQNSQDIDSFILQLSCAGTQSQNETEDIQVHVVGDHHVILRLPPRLAMGKKGSKFDIKVTRADKDLPFDLCKLFDGVFTLRLAREDAYGPMNVTVSSQSKPVINQITSIDFGTPWLKIASWKKATQSLSQSLRKDFDFAQTGLTKVYIKLTFDLQNICGAVCRDINQTAATNDSLQRVARTARDLVAKSKVISDNLRRNAKMSLASSTDHLKTMAKCLQRDAQHVVRNTMSAVQEKTSRIQAPVFNLDLKTKLRDFCKHPALLAAHKNARYCFAKKSDDEKQ
ncbi:hypothetical protein FQN49_000997 [Arthroderma sp. PD_2]|nr:hypothetical protein FQN49_000997 [Arthroderma sp. PD_2]